MENPRIYDTLAAKLWHLHLVDNALVSNNICIYAVYDQNLGHSPHVYTFGFIFNCSGWCKTPDLGKMLLSQLYVLECEFSFS